MHVMDLTQTIGDTMPVYPGTEQPKLTQTNTIEKDGFKETLLRMYSHTGTHMDAPAHIFPGAPTLDALPAEKFTGKACVVDCSDAGEGGRITMRRIQNVRAAADEAEFLLFYTGWSRLWNDGRYFGAYPAFDADVMRYCAAGKKGIGVDTISIDPIDSFELPMHRIVLGAGLVIVENLTNLEGLIGRAFRFAALPLKYENADGAPVRAVALWINSGLRRPLFPALGAGRCGRRYMR